MYAGFITSKRSVSRLGVHQKFNRSAYNALIAYIPEGGFFPVIKDVLHFEGENGPDGLKVKSPGHHEPHHFYDPAEESGEFLGYIEHHFNMLVTALKNKRNKDAAFEAAWLAHTITDGLTPAHHHTAYNDFFDKAAIDFERNTKRNKLFIKGDSPAQTIKNTFEFLGPKGLLSTHQNFEMGVAMAVLPIRLMIEVTDEIMKEMRLDGPVDYFKKMAGEIALLDMYHRFYERGWTVKLAHDVRELLAPMIAETIAVTWARAYELSTT